MDVVGGADPAQDLAVGAPHGKGAECMPAKLAVAPPQPIRQLEACGRASRVLPTELCALYVVGVNELQPAPPVVLLARVSGVLRAQLIEVVRRPVGVGEPGD